MNTNGENSYLFMINLRLLRERREERRTERKKMQTGICERKRGTRERGLGEEGSPFRYERRYAQVINL